MRTPAEREMDRRASRVLIEQMDTSDPINELQQVALRVCYLGHRPTSDELLDIVDRLREEQE